MRAFLAIPVPEALAAVLDPLTDLPNTRAVDTPHLTLHFLGEVRDAVLAEAWEDVATLPLRPVTLTLGALDTLASGAVVVHVVPEPALIDLHDALARRLRQAGLDLPRRRFRPHITVARHGTLTGAEAERLASALGRAARPVGQAAAERLVLYQSLLRPDGAEYHELDDLDFPQD
ncbi:RNA 2',3'-cyclic phosphodiesterase [Falsirhodobacter halotolerans]|uniref:RNA 2',3'-cyclic phosphodiesterase n=1 Tax=Falsirhodobacter halotolerans TaxID=1146892 RepID=UPI001FD38E4E|nr:RNA 2',3'-cyclic phosphodiesterase [Falsirhodobacter halotolerans]MCJ8139262.1 RNA 2',3'-cyclic phosphodiesterase [Falsirhodobacter halotolerans]